MKKINEKLTGWFPIMKTGRVKDSRGRKHDFKIEELDRVVKLYSRRDDNWKEAPVVIGHPATDSPAYGWIDSLQRVDSRLYARAKDVIPAFADQVKEKMYKFVSPSFRADGSLRHVGFLGGTPPAIPGLGEVTPAFADFSGDEDFDSYEFDFAEMEKTGLAYINHHLQRAFAALKKYYDFSDEEEERDIDDPDSTDPDMQKDDENPAAPLVDQDEAAENKIDQKEANMPLTKGESPKKTKESTPPGTAVMEPAGPGEGEVTADFSEELKEKDARIAALEKRLAKLETSAVQKDVSSFAEGLVKAGKLLPKHKPAFVTLLTRLDDSEAFDFAEEGAEKKEEKTLRRAFMDFAEDTFPVQVPLTPIKRGTAGEVKDEDSDDFSEAEPDEKELDLKIKALMKEKNIGYQAAFNELKG